MTTYDHIEYTKKGDAYLGEASIELTIYTSPHGSAHTEGIRHFQDTAHTDIV